MKKAIVKRLQKDRPSLDRDYQFKICLWIAMDKTTTQILDMIEDDFEIKMSPQNININYRYGKKWRPVINYLRTRYLNNISRIPIANKAYRLWILQETLKEALVWRTKSINEYGKIQEKKIGIIPALIQEAREEIEPSNKGVNINDNRPIIINFHVDGKPKPDSDRNILSIIPEENKI